MTDRQTYDRTNPAAGEARHKRRAFGRAMSAGLKTAYAPVTTQSVPDEFMDLLQKADKRRQSQG
ncbi:NepR family anti-sigma factor [Henriciella aquimarina]|uniref:NepR family anti-sigma factor n=1 Tax=Henriciella aquimarina TaxID=545261 RepID=UPI00117B84E6|nr:NepR family anti-sigma factor [Henriciella aquimarina]